MGRPRPLWNAECTCTLASKTCVSFYQPLCGHEETLIPSFLHTEHFQDTEGVTVAEGSPLRTASSGAPESVFSHTRQGQHVCKVNFSHKLTSVPSSPMTDTLLS